MTDARSRIVNAVIWVGGALLGLLSTVAFVLAAAIPAILGLLALTLAPVRALWRRLRG